MAENENPKAKSETKASLEVIPSTVVKKFYGDDGRVWSEGQSFQYVPKADEPYPWPLIRPKDSAKSKELHGQYRRFHENKLDQIAERSDKRRLLDRLGAIGS